MKDYIQIGIEKGLISLNEDRSWITYVYYEKERNAIFHMKCVRDTAMLFFGSFVGQQCIPFSYLKNFEIPLPPKGKQEDTATHVYEQIQRAKALKEKASAFLTMLSRKWSGLLLGGAD